jgi:hypothetical protein
MFRNAVASNYFDAMQLRILRGRACTDDEARAGANVVVISASTSRRLWPNQEPLGRRLRPEPGAPLAEVIGVAQDVQVRLDDADPLFFYLPLKDWTATTQLVRVSGDPGPVKDRVRADARSLDPKVLIEMSSSRAASSLRASSCPRLRTTNGVRTSTRDAPWTLVEGNDKDYARIRVLQTACERLRKAH